MTTPSTSSLFRRPSAEPVSTSDHAEARVGGSAAERRRPAERRCCPHSAAGLQAALNARVGRCKASDGVRSPQASRGALKRAAMAPKTCGRRPRWPPRALSRFAGVGPVRRAQIGIDRARGRKTKLAAPSGTSGRPSGPCCCAALFHHCCNLILQAGSSSRGNVKQGLGAQAVEGSGVNKRGSRSVERAQRRRPRVSRSVKSRSVAISQAC